ncbi:hypothetical protein THAOC_35972 [Thalassiosira oceanica]|uniref:LIM zinc-binding domain-containing protein n=1 Tax=Thalassiosira oceanica TaxID=159749 RepID=K0R2I9_THAOC|nr:hypothetical protein THAOC_35972 [Thalassiosira oceanica]|eukprot:EJK45414.1 hypothetical protein THAOC_35972 [Thalassiosira oceanica]
MLNGVNKRGETVETAPNSHHAEVASILARRRQDGLSNSFSASSNSITSAGGSRKKGRQSNPLSSSLNSSFGLKAQNSSPAEADTSDKCSHGDRSNLISGAVPASPGTTVSDDSLQNSPIRNARNTRRGRSQQPQPRSGTNEQVTTQNHRSLSPNHYRSNPNHNFSLNASGSSMEHSQFSMPMKDPASVNSNVGQDNIRQHKQGKGFSPLAVLRRSIGNTKAAKEDGYPAGATICQETLALSSQDSFAASPKPRRKLLKNLKSKLQKKKPNSSDPGLNNGIAQGNELQEKFDNDTLDNHIQTEHSLSPTGTITMGCLRRRSSDNSVSSPNALNRKTSPPVEPSFTNSSLMEDNDVDPWAPTMNMSLLVKTGQLDRIESESEEESDEDRDTDEKRTAIVSDQKPRRDDGFKGGAEDDDFFNQVANSYLASMKQWENSQQNQSLTQHFRRKNSRDLASAAKMKSVGSPANGVDELDRSLSNDDSSRLSHASETPSSPRPTKEVYGELAEQAKGGRINVAALKSKRFGREEGSVGSDKKSRRLRIGRSLSLVRRGRSRARSESVQRAQPTIVSEASATGVSTDGVVRVSPTEPARPAITDTKEVRRARSRENRRTRSMSRGMGISRLLRSRSEKSPEKRSRTHSVPVQPRPLRRESDGGEMWNDSESSIFIDSTASMVDNTSIGRRGDVNGRPKKCLVCRQRITDSPINHMGFYFHGGCFHCASCRKDLSDVDDLEMHGVQIISNARGSVVQCGECARSMVISRENGAVDSSPVIMASQHSSLSQSPGILPPPPPYKRDSESAATSELGGASISLASTSISAQQVIDKLAERAVVKLSLAIGDNSRVKEHLSTVSFNLPDKEFVHQNESTVAYELVEKESGVNFSSTQKQAISLPKLESDEDGVVSRMLDVDLRLSGEYSYPRPVCTGPAMLSIEAFQSNTISNDTVRKVLRQSWSYEENNLVHKFTFKVPFEKEYISWQIDEGDELDMTQAQLEANIEHTAASATIEESDKEAIDASDESTEIDQGVASVERHASDVQKEVASPRDDGSMPSTIFANRKPSQDNSTVVSSTTGLYEHTSSLVHKTRQVALRDPDRDENDNFSELLSVASAVDSIVALPSITYITVYKKHSDVEVGLSLIEKNGSTVVAEVSKSGLFAKSKLCEGCEILAINGSCVRGPRSVIRMMKDFEGDVVLMVSDSPSPPGAKFVVRRHKVSNSIDWATNSSEMAFQSIDGLVRFESISPDGIFADSSIVKGDICMSIDGVPAANTKVAQRALNRSQSLQGTVAVLYFSLPNFWRSVVQLTINEKYNRYWKDDTECTLYLDGEEESAPVGLVFDMRSGLCRVDGDDVHGVDLSHTNTIIKRVMSLLGETMRAYKKDPKDKLRDSSRSLSVSPSGKLKNRSDVYRRALIKLDEMRENGAISAKDYDAGKHALAEVAIQAAKS